MDNNYLQKEENLSQQDGYNQIITALRKSPGSMSEDFLRAKKNRNIRILLAIFILGMSALNILVAYLNISSKFSLFNAFISGTLLIMGIENLSKAKEHHQEYKFQHTIYNMHSENKS